MGDAEYYREQSEFCAYMSDVARRPEDKARWLKLAAQWRECRGNGTSRPSSRRMILGPSR
jgi:hypothetical protein